MRRLLIALIALIALPAEALEFHIGKEALRLDITETMTAAYNGDLGYLIVTRGPTDPPGTVTRPERHFYDIINRLNAVLQWRRFRLATRFDTAVWFDTPAGSCTADNPQLTHNFCQNYFYLEKASLDYSGRHVEATLGDFYVSFGRGIALSIRKVDEIGIDTTLLGGKMLFHAGDWSGTVVGGLSNIQNVDQATGQVAPDPYDFVGGARVEYRLLNRAVIGLHGTGGIQRDNGHFTPSDSMIHYGGTLDIARVTDWLSLYVEGDGQMKSQSSGWHNAYALYGSALVHKGPIALLLEGKHYSNLLPWAASTFGNSGGTLLAFNNIFYSQPPTAERIVTELKSNLDVTGGRLRIDWTIARPALVYASYGYFHDRSVGQTFHDPYIGAEFRWNEGQSYFFPSGGYRIEVCDRNPDGSPVSGECVNMLANGDFQRIAHAEWTLSQALPAHLSIETSGTALIRSGDNVFGTDPTTGQSVLWQWTEGNANLALKWNPHLMVSGSYEWTTRPGLGYVNQHFLSGQVQYKITPASWVRVQGGGSRGGLKCISGVCRVYPPFTGVLLEVVVRI